MCQKYEASPHVINLVYLGAGIFENTEAEKAGHLQEFIKSILNVPCAEIQAVRTFGLAKGGRGEEKRSWWLFCDFLIIFNPTHVFDLADD